MKIHQAMAELAKLPEGSTMTRRGGLTIRRAVTEEEHKLHLYVTRTDLGMRAFDASKEDFAATDWIVVPREQTREFRRKQEEEERKSRDSLTAND